MYSASEAAASTFFEYLLTASCQPPRVAAFLAPGPVPAGSAATPILSLIGLSAAWPSDQAYGQLRMNAALPFCHTPRESSSP